MIALVAIAVSAVGWLSYRSLEQALLPRVLDRIETNSRLVAENAIIHHGRLDEGVLLLAKPYRKSDMAIMIRKALGD